MKKWMYTLDIYKTDDGEAKRIGHRYVFNQEGDVLARIDIVKMVLEAFDIREEVTFKVTIEYDFDYEEAENDE